MPNSTIALNSIGYFQVQVDEHFVQNDTIEHLFTHLHKSFLNKLIDNNNYNNAREYCLLMAETIMKF